MLSTYYFEESFDSVGEHSVVIANNKDFDKIEGFLKERQSFFKSSKMNVLIKDL